jgi:hypothetical protein
MQPAGHACPHCCLHTSANKCSAENGIQPGSFLRLARGNIFLAHAPFDFPQKAKALDRPLRCVPCVKRNDSHFNTIAPFFFRPCSFHSLCVALVLMASAHPSMHLFIARWARALTIPSSFFAHVLASFPKGLLEDKLTTLPLPPFSLSISSMK